jgi:hypothetical protein
MQDPDLMKLLDAMDLMVTTTGSEVAEAADVAGLRLRCLEQRLGGVAAASPYLQFLRRSAGSSHAYPQGLAASA